MANAPYGNAETDAKLKQAAALLSRTRPVELALTKIHPLAHLNKTSPDRR